MFSFFFAAWEQLFKQFGKELWPPKECQGILVVNQVIEDCFIIAELWKNIGNDLSKLLNADAKFIRVVDEKLKVCRFLKRKG